MADKERREELIARMEPLGRISEGWVARLKANKCPMCGEQVWLADLRDDKSRREFDLSHMCQKCQDDIFFPSPD
jgi:ribosomal protein S27AE